MVRVRVRVLVRVRVRVLVRVRVMSGQPETLARGYARESRTDEGITLKLEELPLKKRRPSNACAYEACGVKKDLHTVNHPEKGPTLLCVAHAMLLDDGEESRPPGGFGHGAEGKADPAPSGIVVRDTAAPTGSDPILAEVSAEEEYATQTLVELRMLPEITTNEELEFFAAELADVKGKNKRLEALKQTATKPMNEALKAVRAIFARPQSALAELEAAIKDRIGRFTVAQEAKRREALAAINPQSDAAAVGNALAIVEETERPQVAGLSVRDAVSFEVTDPALVPREYCEPVPALIRAAIKAGATEIPGVRIFTQPRVASGST